MRGGSQFGSDPFISAVFKILNWIRKRGFLFWLILPIILVGFWFSTGIYIVSPREQGVVRLFGAFSSISDSGLHWRVPSPVTSLVLVDVESIRTDRIGFRIDQDERILRLGDESLMLTTDNSIVEAQLVVQYRVGDPALFAFQVSNPETVLHTSGEVSLRSIVGRTDLVSVLTIGRPAVERETRIFLEHLLSMYNTGIILTDVKLQTVDPPEQVKDAFQEVTRALEDETRLENEALAYEADQIPKAQGQVQVRIRGAAAYQREQIERAKGETNRFLNLLREYRNAPSVTRERLYLETLENVLQTVDKTIVDSELEILPLLNLGGLDSGQGSDSTFLEGRGR
jgi:membrane protease subunit HflK